MWRRQEGGNSPCFGCVGSMMLSWATVGPWMEGEEVLVVSAAADSGCRQVVIMSQWAISSMSSLFHW